MYLYMLAILSINVLKKLRRFKCQFVGFSFTKSQLFFFINTASFAPYVKNSDVNYTIVIQIGHDIIGVNFELA